MDNKKVKNLKRRIHQASSSFVNKGETLVWDAIVDEKHVAISWAEVVEAIDFLASLDAEDTVVANEVVEVKEPKTAKELRDAKEVNSKDQQQS